MTTLNTEEEFRKMVAWYEGSRRKKNATGREAVLWFLVEHPDKIWWWSWEFIGHVTKGGHFLSHRAPARASDLAIMESQLVEDRKVGRFKCYRLRWENIHLVNERLGVAVEMPKFTKTVYVPVFDDAGRQIAVRPKEVTA